MSRTKPLEPRAKTRLVAPPARIRRGVMLRRLARTLDVPPSTSRALSSGRDVLDQSSQSPWRPVRDQKTGGLYWWNPRTNETTAVDVPRPRTEHLADDPAHAARSGGYQRESLGSAMSGSFFMGAGVALGFGLVGALTRVFF